MRVLLAIVFAAVAPAIKHTAADTTLAQASLVKVADFGKGWSGKASRQQGDCKDRFARKAAQRGLKPSR